MNGERTHGVILNVRLVSMLDTLDSWFIFEG